MALIDIINRALDAAGRAYDTFFVNVLGLSPFCDIWKTTSGNPCVFCRHMEQLTATV